MPYSVLATTFLSLPGFCCVAVAESVGLDAFEEGGGGFVVAVFAAGELGLGGDQLASKGFLQDGLREPVGPRGGRRSAPLDRLGEFEEGVDAADDFVLFGEWTPTNFICCHTTVRLTPE
ncbi:MAG: hypothetical protein L0228_08000 [Planctomycetes bacterium]|nr:hypothetical protein [Planctomycetota bacterium]